MASTMTKRRTTRTRKVSNHNWPLELHLRHWAQFRIKGMIGNLKVIKLGTPLSSVEVDYINFAQEVLEQLDVEWGKVVWESKKEDSSADA